jgi:hypothetical protein
MFSLLAYLENGRHPGRACLHQILFKLGKKCNSNFSNIQVAFAKQKLQITQVSEWFSKFKNNVTTVENTQHSQCPPTCQTEKKVD